MTVQELDPSAGVHVESFEHRRVIKVRKPVGAIRQIGLIAKKVEKR